MGEKGKFPNFKLNVNYLQSITKQDINLPLSLWTTTTIWNINPVNHQSNMPNKGRFFTAYLTLWSQSILVHLNKKTQQVIKGHKKYNKTKISLKQTKPTDYNDLFYFEQIAEESSSVGILLARFFRYHDHYGEFILMASITTEWSKKDQLRSSSGQLSMHLLIGSKKTIFLSQIDKAFTTHCTALIWHFRKKRCRELGINWIVKKRHYIAVVEI